jgi:hypothetical protein
MVQRACLLVCLLIDQYHTSVTTQYNSIYDIAKYAYDVHRTRIHACTYDFLALQDTV